MLKLNIIKNNTIMQKKKKNAKEKKTLHHRSTELGMQLCKVPHCVVLIISRRKKKKEIYSNQIPHSLSLCAFRKSRKGR